MSSNLPPGVSESMIPGNQPEDIVWELFYAGIDKDTAENKMSDMDAFVAWKLGLAAYKASKASGARYPHN